MLVCDLQIITKVDWPHYLLDLIQIENICKILVENLNIKVFWFKQSLLKLLKKNAIV